MLNYQKTVFIVSLLACLSLRCALFSSEAGICDSYCDMIECSLIEELSCEEQSLDVFKDTCTDVCEQESTNLSPRSDRALSECLGCMDQLKKTPDECAPYLDDDVVEYQCEDACSAIVMNDSEDLEEFLSDFMRALEPELEDIIAQYCFNN